MGNESEWTDQKKKSLKWVALSRTILLKNLIALLLNSLSLSSLVNLKSIFVVEDLVKKMLQEIR